MRGVTGVVGAIGKVVVDEVLLCEGPPAPDTHQNVTRLLTAGGAPANVASQLAAHAHPAILSGWAGADAASGEVLAALASAGVTLRLTRRDRAPVATVLAWAGDRAFLVDQGSLRAHSADLNPTWLDGMAVAHFNGFELLDYCWPDVLAEVAALAHARGIAVSVDCPTANRMTAQGTGRFLAALQAMAPDVVFCNADEAQALGFSTRPPWIGLLAVHAGTAPTEVHGPHGTSRHEVTDVVTEPETTGCGDAFAAGFLAVWAAGGDIADAVAQAHVWGAEQARVTGAQPAAAAAAAPDEPTAPSPTRMP